MFCHDTPKILANFFDLVTERLVRKNLVEAVVPYTDAKRQTVLVDFPFVFEGRRIVKPGRDAAFSEDLLDVIDDQHRIARNPHVRDVVQGVQEPRLTSSHWGLLPFTPFGVLPSP